MTAPALSSRPAMAGRLDLTGSIPFFGVHLACGLALFCGVGWAEVALCVASFAVRMFGITAGYHRYFSHRSFRAGRAFQLVLAVLAVSSLQKGVLWWGAHHRDHHRYSDTDDDVHSPVRRGFFWAHVGWILSTEHGACDQERIKDFARFPELRWLERWHVLPFVVFAVGLFWLGGLSFLVWGGFISTVLLWHVTFCINSLAHVYGSRRFQTRDASRNNWWLALLTGGEGWHNNHHRYQASVRQGFYWWEIDWTYYGLRALQAVGLVSGLRTPPARLLQEGRGARKSAALRAVARSVRPVARRLPRTPPSAAVAPSVAGRGGIQPGVGGCR